MLSMPLIFPIIGWLMIYAKAGIDPIRMAIYFLFSSAAILSCYLSGKAFSASSVFLVLATYITWTVELRVSRHVYQRCMNVFVWAALVGAGLVIVQQLAQAAGYPGWLNLETVIPEPLLQKGYNYLQPYEFLSKKIKPNGVFFLESSFVSQFVALGFVIEASLFRRMGRLALMGVALPLTYAGTGLIIVGLCLPVLLIRASAKLAFAGIAALALLGAAGYATGWYDTIAPRLTEVNREGSSGYYRYTAPTLEAMDRLNQPDAILAGDGAGGVWVDASDPTVHEPVIKVLLEYGLLTALLYTSFMLYCMFYRAPDFAISWAFLLFLNTGGGYMLTPVVVLACLLGCILLRIDDDAAEPVRSLHAPVPA